MYPYTLLPQPWCGHAMLKGAVQDHVICMYHIYVCMCMRSYRCVYVYTHVCTQHACIHVYVNICLYIYVCMYVCIYVCM